MNPVIPKNNGGGIGNAVNAHQGAGLKISRLSPISTIHSDILISIGM